MTFKDKLDKKVEVLRQSVNDNFNQPIDTAVLMAKTSNKLRTIYGVPYFYIDLLCVGLLVIAVITTWFNAWTVISMIFTAWFIFGLIVDYREYKRVWSVKNGKTN